MAGTVTVDRTSRTSEVHAVVWNVEGLSDRPVREERRDGRDCRVYTLTSPAFTTKMKNAVNNDWELSLEVVGWCDDHTYQHSAVVRAAGGAALRTRLRCTLLCGGREYPGETAGDVSFSEGVSHAVTLRGATFSGLSLPCTLRCEIETVDESTALQSAPPVGISWWISKITSIFGSKELSDVVLVTKTGELPAHKFILSARCEVFKKMFEHQFRENIDGKVPMEDHDADLVQEMLRYIYLGEVERLDTFAPQLLPLADLYELDELKKICLSAMFPAITADNAAEALIVADLFRVGDIKAAAIAFIRRNFEALSRAKKLRELKKKPELLLECADEADEE